MADALTIVTSITLLLLVGMLSSILANKFKISEVLILLLVGMVIGKINYQGQSIVSFPQTFLISISIIALVMIIFDASSNFKLRELDTLSFKALKLISIFLLFNLIFLTIAVKVVFGIPIIFALMFSSLMAGTSPSATLTMLKAKKQKVVQILKIESILNTPLVVLLPFLILDMRGIEFNLLFTKFVQQISPFLQQIINGVGTGVVLGIIAFEIMRERYSEKYSPIAMTIMALLTYIVAENLGGNGVLSVTTLGLLFGNFRFKEKVGIKTFGTAFANLLEILVFILIGLVIKIPLTKDFLLSSLYLFFVYILIRYVSVMVFARKEKFTFKEKLFMTFNIPKGIAVAVVAFILATYTAIEIKILLDLILAFILYSIILSTIVTAFQGFFLGKEAV